MITFSQVAGLGPCEEIPGGADDYGFGGGGGGPLPGIPSGGGIGGSPSKLVPKPWPKTMFKAELSCWSDSSIGHTCRVQGNYLTADEGYIKLQQINCCAGTAQGGAPQRIK